MSTQVLGLEKSFQHQCRDLARNSTLETENQLIIKKTSLKTRQRLTNPEAYPTHVDLTSTYACCVNSWQTHLDLNDQYYT